MLCIESLFLPAPANQQCLNLPKSQHIEHLAIESREKRLLTSSFTFHTLSNHSTEEIQFSKDVIHLHSMYSQPCLMGDTRKWIN